MKHKDFLKLRNEIWRIVDNNQLSNDGKVSQIASMLEVIAGDTKSKRKFQYPPFDEAKLNLFKDEIKELIKREQLMETEAEGVKGFPVWNRLFYKLISVLKIDQVHFVSFLRETNSIIQDSQRKSTRTHKFGRKNKRVFFLTSDFIFSSETTENTVTPISSLSVVAESVENTQ